MAAALLRRTAVRWKARSTPFSSLAQPNIKGKLWGDLASLSPKDKHEILLGAWRQAPTVQLVPDPDDRDRGGCEVVVPDNKRASHTPAAAQQPNTASLEFRSDEEMDAFLQKETEQQEAEQRIPTLRLASQFFEDLAATANEELNRNEAEDGQPPPVLTDEQRREEERAFQAAYFGTYYQQQGLIAPEDSLALQRLFGQRLGVARLRINAEFPLSRLIIRHQLERTGHTFAPTSDPLLFEVQTSAGDADRLSAEFSAKLLPPTASAEAEGAATEHSDNVSAEEWRSNCETASSDGSPTRPEEEEATASACEVLQDLLSSGVGEGPDASSFTSAAAAASFQNETPNTTDFPVTSLQQREPGARATPLAHVDSGKRAIVKDCRTRYREGVQPATVGHLFWLQRQVASNAVVLMDTLSQLVVMLAVHLCYASYPFPEEAGEESPSLSVVLDIHGVCKSNPLLAQKKTMWGEKEPEPQDYCFYRDVASCVTEEMMYLKHLVGDLDHPGVQVKGGTIEAEDPPQRREVRRRLRCLQSTCLALFLPPYVREPTSQQTPQPQKNTARLLLQKRLAAAVEGSPLLLLLEPPPSPLRRGKPIHQNDPHATVKRNALAKYDSQSARNTHNTHHHHLPSVLRERCCVVLCAPKTSEDGHRVRSFDEQSEEDTSTTTPKFSGASCSTGDRVAAPHNFILRCREAGENFQRLQRELRWALESTSDGGYVVYITRSLNPIENEAVVCSVLSSHLKYHQAASESGAEEQLFVPLRGVQSVECVDLQTDTAVSSLLHDDAFETSPALALWRELWESHREGLREWVAVEGGPADQECTWCLPGVADEVARAARRVDPLHVQDDAWFALVLRVQRLPPEPLALATFTTEKAADRASPGMNSSSLLSSHALASPSLIRTDPAHLTSDPSFHLIARLPFHKTPQSNERGETLRTASWLPVSLCSSVLMNWVQHQHISEERKAAWNRWRVRSVGLPVGVCPSAALLASPSKEESNAQVLSSYCWGVPVPSSTLLTDVLFYSGIVSGTVWTSSAVTDNREQKVDLPPSESTAAHWQCPFTMLPPLRMPLWLLVEFLRVRSFGIATLRASFEQWQCTTLSTEVQHTFKESLQRELHQFLEDVLQLVKSRTDEIKTTPLKAVATPVGFTVLIQPTAASVQDPRDLTVMALGDTMNRSDHVFRLSPVVEDELHDVRLVARVTASSSRTTPTQDQDVRLQLEDPLQNSVGFLEGWEAVNASPEKLKAQMYEMTVRVRDALLYVARHADPLWAKTVSTFQYMAGTHHCEIKARPPPHRSMKRTRRSQNAHRSHEDRTSPPAAEAVVLEEDEYAVLTPQEQSIALSSSNPSSQREPNPLPARDLYASNVRWEKEANIMEEWNRKPPVNSWRQDLSARLRPPVPPFLPKR